MRVKYAVFLIRDLLDIFVYVTLFLLVHVFVYITTLG